ncbi:MAG TPA: hypothetical protein VNL92_05330 [Dehalococcoidia bacterium]|nr:hypothetical protein [Dehalococcoidia bacterium]
MPDVAYTLPEYTYNRLERLVDGIEAKPGKPVEIGAFAAMEANLKVRSVLGTLPNGLSDDDFVGILRLAMLTECATETYGRAIGERARMFDARWLERFNTNVWIPDELSHATPYEMLLRDLGFAPAQLRRDIRETQQKAFEHKGGDTPVHVTAFGMIQEYLTDHWHGLIGGLLRPSSPDGSRLVRQVKRRETLHTMWYRDMTALQVEAQPRYIAYVAEAMAQFEMPGNSLVPELQSQASRWLPLMNADFEQLLRDLTRIIYEVMGNARSVGKLLGDLAAELGIKLGPIPARHLNAAISRLGGPGHGLLGEALLERAGLRHLYQREPPNEASHPVARLRALLRSWVARQMESRLDLARLAG